MKAATQPIIAVLDTNLLYGVATRDILLWFAFFGLYTLKWSLHILEEWKVVMLRKSISEAEVLNRMTQVTGAFPRAEVLDYVPIIDTLELPDPKDRHVLAAALTCNAQYIITSNLKDFPPAYLHLLGVQAISPDDFLSGLVEEDSASALEAFKTMVAQKKNPPVEEAVVLAQMRKADLVVTADTLLRSL